MAVNTLTGEVIGSAAWSNHGLFLHTRTASNLTTIYKDGVSLNTSPNASDALPAQVVDIGRRGGTSPTFYSNATISSYIIGAAVGFDHAAHNTNLRTLLTALGA